MNEDKKRNIQFSIFLVGAIVTTFLYTAIVTAIPSIMNDLDITAATAQWLISGYSLVMGVMIPATAYLNKRFTAKNLFLSAMTIFTAGLILAATAKSFGLLLAGRILQAMGNGILATLTQVVIFRLYPIEKRGSVMGLVGFASGVSPVIAPTVAGLIVDSVGWNAIFGLCIILTVIIIAVAVKVLDDISEKVKRRFDVLSMILCSIGFSGILFGLSNILSKPFISVYVALPLGLSICSLIVFVKRQLILEQPFLDVSILKNRNFRLAVMFSMIFYGIMIALSAILPIYVQTLRGFSATVSGLLTMPGSLVMASISPFVGKIFDKIGINKIFITGSGVLLLSTIGFSFLNDSISLPVIIAIHITELIAIGLMLMPTTTWGLNSVSKDKTAHGSALLTSLRTIAGSVSAAVFISIMTVASTANNNLTVMEGKFYGAKVTYISIAALALLQFIMAIIFMRKRTNIQINIKDNLIKESV